MCRMMQLTFKPYPLHMILITAGMHHATHQGSGIVSQFVDWKEKGWGYAIWEQLSEQ